MLKSTLLQPQILNALGAAGHGARVLIADGNYPLSTMSPPTAERVYLNLAPGIVSATDVLKVVADAIPIEAAQVMQPASGGEAPIFMEFRKCLPDGVALEALGRFDFYDASANPATCLAIATGEQRIYANILLTIGVVLPLDGSQDGLLKPG